MKEYIKGEKGPIIIRPIVNSKKPIDWLADNKPNLRVLLNTHGAILLRNFKIHSLSEFSKFSNALSPDLLDYKFRSTPRTTLGEKIYTATEYPQDRAIPVHNENSYTDDWPETVVFYCIVPPDTDGYTPLANSANVLNRIDSNLVKKFESNDVKYIRNYFTGIDLCWQNVFQTDKKGSVEQYCRDHNILYQWHEGQPELTTKQTRQATTLHPYTNQKVWFNQAHLFHPSSIHSQELDLIKKATNGVYPRNVMYGDNSTIKVEEINIIREAYDKETITFEWKRGDILIVDNLLMAHGRTPYKGKRKIVVSMY